ncbi:hypothetical protein HOY82DRAFT_537218 [Tuber indicum]|nr:hypothetical protein HOY82DRAFT_537218 [Tuber indicum]
MTTTSYFNLFFLTSLFLHYSSIFAVPTSVADSVIKAPEIGVMSPYFTQLMQALPLLPSPENATSLAASRKILSDAIETFNRNYKHLKGDEVTSAEHQICETSGMSPRWLDALAAAHRILNIGDRCVMTRRCTEFSTWGEAAIGACTRAFFLWDLECRTMWRWVVGVCMGCSSNINGEDRSGGRFMFDDKSQSDVRVYRN